MDWSRQQSSTHAQDPSNPSSSLARVKPRFAAAAKICSSGFDQMSSGDSTSTIAYAQVITLLAGAGIAYFLLAPKKKAAASKGRSTIASDQDAWKSVRPSRETNLPAPIATSEPAGKISAKQEDRTELARKNCFHGQAYAAMKAEAESLKVCHNLALHVAYESHKSFVDATYFLSF